MSEMYSKLRHVDPDLLIEHGGLDREAAIFIRAACNANDLVAALLDDPARHMDLAKILAFMLPAQEAVRWACLIAALEEQRSGLVNESGELACARSWVENPNDATARCAFDLAESAGLDLPSGWAAMATFWSSSSIGSPDEPPIKPATHLTGLAVGMAVALACLSERVAVPIHISDVLAIGLDIASGGTGQALAREAGKKGRFAA